jgi:hypothetical protein
VVLVAALGPAIAAGLDRRAGPPREVAAPALRAPAGCVAVATGLDCDGALVAARLYLFPGRANWSAVAAERRRAQAGSDEDITFAVPVPGRAAWQARQFADAPGLAATATWLDGQPVGDGLRSRATQAWHGLMGGTGGPVLAAVQLRPGAAPLPAAAGRALLRSVLEAQSDGLAAAAAALSAGR